MLHPSNTMIVIHMGRGMVWHGMPPFPWGYVPLNTLIHLVPPRRLERIPPHSSQRMIPIHPSIHPWRAMACHSLGAMFHANTNTKLEVGVLSLSLSGYVPLTHLVPQEKP